MGRPLGAGRNVADVVITRDGPEAAPFTYTLGATEYWEAESIQATFDGGGASGTFLPCCSVYSQDGRLLSRDYPPGVTVAAGSEVGVSYHPRRAAAVAAASGTSLSWGMVRRDSQVVASGSGFTAVDFDTTNVNVQFGSSGDGVVSVTVGAGGTHVLTLNTQGVYYVSWHAHGNTTGAVGAGAVTDTRCDFDTGDVLAGGYYSDFLADPGGVTKISDAGIAMVLDLDPANYPIPNKGKLTMRQNSGVNVTYSFVMSAVLLSTVTDPNIF